KEWDSQAGKEKTPVEYEIVELSAEKLVLKKKSDNTSHIYLEKGKFEAKAKEFAEKEKANKKVDTTAQKKTTDIPEGVDESKLKKDWKVGDKAEIYWKGTWYKGKVVANKNEAGKIKISYDGWDSKWDEYVDIRRMRELKK
ncbi:MAG: hypothetical protein SFU27_02070, partial [Thermonemataceae bacterium]|nr:hypothetical protein [Thermonemataceae bacterium]